MIDHERARLCPGWGTGLVAAAALFAIAACAPEEEGADGSADAEDVSELRLGALMPMTGDLQAYGETSLNGMQLAVRQINEQGGVNGQEVVIEVGDTQTAPQPGIDAAQQLVNVFGAHALVGALSSGVTIPVAESVTSEEGVVQISPASTSPVLTDIEDDDFLFRTVPSDAFQGLALAELVAEDGLEGVSILYINNDYGEGLAESFTDSFEAGGGSVVATQAYDDGAGSYRGELSSVSGDDAEALVLIGYPENGITILRQALEEGHFDRFVFTDGLKSPDIIEEVGSQALEGSYGSVPQAPEDSQAAENYASAYDDAYGERPPQPFIDTSYDAAFVAALAAQAAGSRDRTAIRDHLRDVANAPGEEILPGEWGKAVDLLEAGEEIQYTGASGSIEFDDSGDVAGSFAHWVIEDGAIRTVRVFEPELD